MRRAAGVTRASRPLAGALAALGLGLAPLAAQADLDLGGWSLSGEAELGGRAISGDDWSSAKYEEFREQRPGLFGSGSFQLEDPSDRWYLRGWLDQVGERDERYELEAGRWGHYRLSLEYLELPVVFSNQALSYYVADPDERFQFVGLHPVALDYRLREGSVGLHWEPRADLALDGGYRLQHREGKRPGSIAFGTPGGNFIDLATAIDERIHEARAGLELAREGWSVEAGYRGSFFENDIDRFLVPNFPGDGFAPPASTFQSPVVAPGFSDLGQISTAPDNSEHTLRFGGGLSLPLGFPARLSASFAHGRRRQDEDFLCHTVNSAILASVGVTSTPGESCPLLSQSPTPGSLELPANSLDGEIQTWLVHLVLTARPLPALHLTARYRFYDYDNQTPRLVFPDDVQNDTTLRSDPEDLRVSVASEHQQQRVSLDSSYRLARGLTLRAGYDWEQWSRSKDRPVQRTDEHGGKLALDWRPDPRLQIRTSYALAVRRGNDYEPFAYLRESTPLTGSDLSDRVFAELRKYDVADRVRDRADLLAQLAPRDDLALTLTASWMKSDYDHSGYGLGSDERWNAGAEIAWRPLERLGVSTWYTFEDFDFEQSARWRAPGLDSPANDWTSSSRDRIHNLGAGLDLTLLPERLDAHLFYELQDARGKTRASGPSLATGDAVDYPALRDVLQTLGVTLAYHLRDDLTLKAAWRLERFDLADFRIDDLDPTEGGSSEAIYLADRIDDYTANIFALGVVFRF